MPTNPFTTDEATDLAAGANSQGTRLDGTAYTATQVEGWLTWISAEQIHFLKLLAAYIKAHSSG